MTSFFVLSFLLGAFFVAFVLFWSAIVMLISLVSGWRKLAELYDCPSAPTGETFGWQSVMLGWARYKSTAWITVSDPGVHMALMRAFQVGHPPLLIPWGDIASVETSSFLGMRSARVTLSKQTGRSMHIYGKSGEAIHSGWQKRQPTASDA